MNKALFEIMRFQILSASLTDGPAQRLGDAYVYAWYVGVFPLFDEGATSHLPFEEQFEVSKEMMTNLSKYLDDCWRNNAAPTFYEIEDHYNLMMGSGPWDRGSLVTACRYMWLHRHLFDQTFWQTVLTPGKHPAEASTLDGNLNRREDIFFQ